MARWIDLAANYKVNNGVLEKCILAEIGYAKGHTTDDGMPLYCDETTLETWLKLVKDHPETIPCTLNHSGDIRDVIAEVVKDTVEVVDGKLVASIKFLKVAFERSTNYVGEFIQSLASEDNTLVNVSVETEIDSEVKDGVALMRPKFLDSVSLVIFGALTNKLQNFSAVKQAQINKVKESIMAEEIKSEDVKPVEQPTPEAAKCADPAPEVQPQPETKPEEAKPAEPTLADVLAKIDALQALLAPLMSIGEEMKAAKAESLKAELSKKTQTVKLAATTDIEQTVEASGTEKLDLNRIKTDQKYYSEHKKEYFNYLRSQSNKSE